MFCDVTLDAINITADVNAICHRFFVTIFHHQVLLKKTERLLRRRCRKPNEIRVKIFQHLSPEIINGAMAFICNDKIKGLNRNSRIVFYRHRFFE